MGLYRTQIVNTRKTNDPSILSTSLSQPINTSLADQSSLPESLKYHQANIDTALKSIFPEHQAESQLQKARLIFGDSLEALSDEELTVYLTEFQYLLDAWLDEFEKIVCDGQTLHQLLSEG